MKVWPFSVARCPCVTSETILSVYYVSVLRFPVSLICFSVWHKILSIKDAIWHVVYKNCTME